MSWSPTNPPKRPGHYLNFKSQAQAIILPSAAGTVFVPFVSDWGPFKTVVTLGSWQEYLAMYGANDTPGAIAINGAFRGEGIPGFPGAGRVLAYRFGGASAAKAQRTLQNTTPATALTISARYEGAFGNNLSITVQTNAADGTKKDLLVLNGTSVLEEYEGVAPDDMAALVATINARSGWITAAVGADGVALANVTAQALTGGDDGATLASGDWSAVFDVAGAQSFSVFGPFDLTDDTIQAALKAWAQDQNNNKGRRFSVMLGGAANELGSAAVTRAAAMNDENIQTLGVGQFLDPDYGSLSTAQLAPRAAGILAARGMFRDMTYARFAGLDFDTSANSVPTESDLISGIDNGFMAIGADSHPLAPLRIELGTTTFRDAANPDKDPAVFSVPKFVMTMQEFERQLKDFAIVNVITPQLAITKDTREYVLGEALRILDGMVAAGVLQPGPTATISQNPPPAPTDDFINIDYTWTFARSVRQVRGTAYVL